MPHPITPFFSTDLFMPHGYCYLWKPSLVGLHILSDALIALAYYSIPLTLFYFVRKRRDLPFGWVFLLFSAFIVACGTTHLMAIWTLWHPTYWLSGGLKLVTAVISLTTAVLLVPLVPVALALPSPAQLEAANRALQDEITDRKQTEQSLSRLAAIVESSGDAIIGKSLDGTITSWNAGAEKLFGYTAADMINRSIALLFPPDQAAELPQVLEQIKQGETIESYETARVRQDGQRIEIAATISPIKNATGEVIGAAKIARDITARKRTEAALQNSENRFQAFMNNSPTASWMTDADGRVLYMSQTYAHLVQVPADAIGKTAFELFTPEIAAPVHQNIQQVVATRQTVKAIEVVPRPDGTPGKFLVYKFPLNEISGQAVVGGVAVDVTDLERAKDELRSLNDRLQYLLNHTPMVIFSCKAHGDYGATWISENAKTLLGYEPQAFLTDSGFWATQIHPEDRDRVFANVSQIFVTGHHAHEYRFRHRDGAYRWVYNQLQLMRDDTGNPLEIIGYLTDISDRKRAEEALRRYERIVSATTDAILLLDRNYRYQVVNQAYLNWYNRSGDDITGKLVTDLLPLDVFEQTIKPRLDQCLAGQSLQYEMWHEYPTMGRQFLSVTYDPYVDASNTVSGVVVSLRNLTKIKQTEVELELQSVIVSHMAEGVCLVKATDGTIAYANPKFEQMFGYEAGELKGNHVSIVNYADEQTSAEAVNQAIQAAVLQQGEATYEVQNIKKDGTPFWCQATTSLFEHPAYGTVLVAVQQDITERKNAERLIQASLEEKEVLLKEIHHRVKNNLGVIDGLLQMQSRRSQNADVIATLKESQNRIASIALVHEKLYRSDYLAKIDFTQYIADLTAHLFDSYNIHPNQIKLTTHIAAVSLDIETAIPCGLIINELISNALKYAFPNIQTGEIQVTLQQQYEHDQSLILIVQDNGIGLPQDFNLKQTKTLGITLVKGLVKQLNGTLEVQSQPGTAFKILLGRV